MSPRKAAQQMWTIVSNGALLLVGVIFTIVVFVMFAKFVLVPLVPIATVIAVLFCTLYAVEKRRFSSVVGVGLYITSCFTSDSLGTIPTVLIACLGVVLWFSAVWSSVKIARLTPESEIWHY